MILGLPNSQTPIIADLRGWHRILGIFFFNQQDTLDQTFWSAPIDNEAQDIIYSMSKLSRIE